MLAVIHMYMTTKPSLCAFLDFSINGLCTGGQFKNVNITTDPNTITTLKQVLDLVNSNNFIATAPRFSEKFDHPFSHVLIFGNMFSESHGFVAVSGTGSNNFVYIH